MEPRDQDKEEPEIPMTELSSLSAGERRVLDQALMGLTVRDIATRLFLTEATVKTHLAHIYDKLGVRGRVDLMARLRDVPERPIVGQERSKADGPAPRRGGFPAWMLPAALLLVASLILVIGAVVGLSNRAERMTSEGLASQLESGVIAEIRSEGARITAVTEDGREYDVSASGRVEVRRLAMANDVPYAEAPAAPAPAVMLVLISVAPYGVALGLIWLAWIVFRPRRRRDHPRPA